MAWLDIFEAAEAGKKKGEVLLGLFGEPADKALYSKVKNKRFPPPGFDTWATENRRRNTAPHLEKTRANAQKLGDWDKGGDARDFSNEHDLLVQQVYEEAELMAVLGQRNKSPDFYELGKRLAQCLELLGNPPLPEPDWQIEANGKPDFRPREKPLPLTFSPEWCDAVEGQKFMRERIKKSLTELPKCPVSGEFVYRDENGLPIPKPERGRPRKYAGDNRKVDYRRRRDELESILEQGELHRIIDEDKTLLSVIDRHVADLERGGYQPNAAVIKRACRALAVGRLELARLIENTVQPETAEQSSPSEEAAVVRIGGDG